MTDNEQQEQQPTPIIKPTKKRRLTLKQQKFVKTYIENGGNATQAVLETYDTDDYGIAASVGNENLNKPNIQEQIKTLQQQFVEDSSWIYHEQKKLFKSTDDEKLKNQIANKILDRAGFMPVKKSENKTIQARFTIRRG